MRPGDLVQFKRNDGALVLGGHRYLDSKRYWWIDNKIEKTNSNDVFVLIERDPKLYGIDAEELHKEKHTAILMDSSTRKFLIASTKQLRTVNSVLRSKK